MITSASVRNSLKSVTRPSVSHRLGRREVIDSPPDKVTAITPSNLSVNLQLDQTISWGRPLRAQSYDVHLGATTETLVLVSDGQVARVFVPTLALDTTYYFRIDSVNTLGTTTGDVVSFSTWNADDIWTDQDGVPWTDQDGIYIPHERV